MQLNIFLKKKLTQNRYLSNQYIRECLKIIDTMYSKYESFARIFNSQAR